MGTWEGSRQLSTPYILDTGCHVAHFLVNGNCKSIFDMTNHGTGRWQLSPILCLPALFVSAHGNIPMQQSERECPCRTMCPHVSQRDPGRSRLAAHMKPADEAIGMWQPHSLSVPIAEYGMTCGISRRRTCAESRDNRRQWRPCSVLRFTAWSPSVCAARIVEERAPGNSVDRHPRLCRTQEKSDVSTCSQESQIGV